MLRSDRAGRTATLRNRVRGIGQLRVRNASAIASGEDLALRSPAIAIECRYIAAKIGAM